MSSPENAGCPRGLRALAPISAGLALACLFACGGGSSHSSTAPAITTQPADLTVASGQPATFTAAASGDPAPTFQWQRGTAGAWTSVSGATNVTYSFTTADADTGATFRLLATNSQGTATSNAATLTVIPAAPTLTTQPASTSVTAGQTATFTVVAAGGGTLAYQWQRSGDSGATWAAVTTGSGGTTASYVTAATALADSGTQFRVAVTNAGGTLDSSAATLTVTASVTSGGSGATFADGPNMTVARMGHSSINLADGRIILLGGHGTGFTSLGTADLWTPATHAFTTLTMNDTHDGGALATLADGTYLLAGGAADWGVAPGYATAELYNPATNTFTPTGSMVHPRMLCTAATLAGGKVLIVGGWYDTASATYGELYDPATGTFTATGALNTPRAQPMVLPTSDGKAVICGGVGIYGTPAFDQVELFDPATGTFSVLQSSLFSGQTGWAIYAFWHNFAVPIDHQLLADGRYLLMAANTTLNQQVLFTFDPQTKTFATFGAAHSTATDAFQGRPVLDTANGKAYLLGVLGTPVPQQLDLYTVTLATGALSTPTGTYTLPASTYVTSAGTNLAAGSVFITGGTSANDSNTNFDPFTRTLLATPTQ